MTKALTALFWLLVAPAAQAADSPETVYGKFHAAVVAKKFAEAGKYASDFTSILVRGGDVDKMPLKALVPKSYKVLGTQIAPHGNSATLSLEGHYEFASGPTPDAKGSIGLVKERGQWKVDNGSWRSR